MENLRKYGNPPFKIAVIHGGPGAYGEMSPIAQTLSSKLGVLEPFQTSLSVGGEINELKNHILGYGSPPITLIGYSWGAWLSLLTAIYYKSLIKRVIIIGCGPLKQQYAHKIIETRFSRLNQEEQKKFESVLKDLNDPSIENTTHLLIQLKKYTDKTDQYNPINKKGTIIKFNKKVFQNVWEEASTLRKNGKLLKLIENIECPVIAIHGTYDPHPIDGVRIPLSSKLENFRIIELKKCGHKPWIEKEAKDKFYRILQKELL
jgi:pimeloyl-ACP methyl ester carboxylesterase